MTQIINDLAKLGFNYLGAYVKDAKYDYFDLVKSDNSLFLSLQDDNTGHELPKDDDDWWAVIFDGSSAGVATKAALEAAQKALAAAEAAAPVIETIEGTEITLDVQGNHKYICGELKSLTISSVEQSALESTIWFRSGATKTQLTMPDGIQEKVIGYSIPATNTDYEINIANGIPLIVNTH